MEGVNINYSFILISYWNSHSYNILIYLLIFNSVNFFCFIYFHYRYNINVIYVYITFLILLFLIHINKCTLKLNGYCQQSFHNKHLNFILGCELEWVNFCHSPKLKYFFVFRWTCHYFFLLATNFIDEPVVMLPFHYC